MKKRILTKEYSRMVLSIFLMVSFVLSGTSGLFLERASAAVVDDGGGWIDVSDCYDSGDGWVIDQEREYDEEVCGECPTITWTKTREVKTNDYDDCPSGYSIDSGDNSKCIKTEIRYACKINKSGEGWVCPNDDSSYGFVSEPPSHGPGNCSHGSCSREIVISQDREFKTEIETFSIDLKYTKANAPNKCHRPEPSLFDFPDWVSESDYNNENRPFFDFDPDDCEMVTKKDQRSISCEPENSIPFYQGDSHCPRGTVENLIGIYTIDSTDPDGEMVSVIGGELNLFRAIGTFVPTSAPNWFADAGYSTNDNWGSVLLDYGIYGKDPNFGAHALLANLGDGVR